MKFEEDRLWQALGAMRIEAEGSPLTFVDKLAREEGWSRARAAAVAGEYRRFLYLAATSPNPVTPSQDVDRAWHLHLTYSRHYWDVLCGKILGKPLHHDPGDGSVADAAGHREQYRATLALYRDTFASPAPAAIWPDPAATPRPPAPRRRPLLASGAAAGAALLVAACSTAVGPGGSSPGNTTLTFFAVFGGLLILALILRQFIGRKGRGEGGGGDCGGGSCSGGSYYGGDSSPSSGSDSGSSGGGSDGGGSSCGGGGCGGGGGD
jgi:hypothetical protein